VSLNNIQQIAALCITRVTLNRKNRG
jgi:hypothetical protein